MMVSSPYLKTSAAAAQRKRHPLFDTDNVITKTFLPPSSTPSSNPYQDLVPSSSPQSLSSPNSFFQALLPQTRQNQQQNKRGKIYHDVTVLFTNPNDGATQLFRQLQQNTNKKQLQSKIIIPHLTQYLSLYQSILSSSPQFIHKKKEITFKARIVVTQGSIGTKCPRWHVDHVPLRLLVALLGPGCEFIPHTAETKGIQSSSSSKEEEEVDKEQNNVVLVVDRQILNNCDIQDTNMANALIVPKTNNKNNEKEEEGGIVQHAKENEAVLLMGREWEDDVDDGEYKNEEEDDDNNGNNSKSSQKVRAAVHKSPELKSNENRVLLTVDIVPP